MISHVVVETFLSSGLVGVSGALAWQIRAKRAVCGTLTQDRNSLRVAEGSAQENLELAQRNYRFFNAVIDETRHFVEVRLPALVDAEARRHPGVVVPEFKDPLLSQTSLPELHTLAAATVHEAIEVVRDDVSRSARAGVRAVAEDAQTALTRCHQLIDEELKKPPAVGPQEPDDAHRQALIGFDHLVTRALHFVQRLRILAGSWPGIQRADCTFAEIIESARGRVDDYRRVAYTYLSDTAEVFVEGLVAEPLAVALMELVDNATSFSSGEVSVYLRRVETGYVIVVDDGGLGMNNFQRAEAERLLSQANDMDVTNLTDERALGFAVVGRLAQTYGFRADVSALSPAGGVRAQLWIPRELLGERPTEPAHAPGPSADTPPGQRPTATTTPNVDPSVVPGEQGLPALPRRDRRADIAVTASVGMEAATDSADPETLAEQLATRRAALAKDLENFPATESGHHHD
ncbi:ATP-binding protein [Streptomyces sp. NPDC047525]|uniref:ATP-binding protein n=1 Tax=Streptomyces sp. NPDC047525 TaxID=3155264 RepID=UPI0033C9CEB7